VPLTGIKLQLVMAAEGSTLVKAFVRLQLLSVSNSISLKYKINSIHRYMVLW
jgi:hypothetical protein